jgi:hypothetical protein
VTSGLPAVALGSQEQVSARIYLLLLLYFFNTLDLNSLSIVELWTSLD